MKPMAFVHHIFAFLLLSYAGFQQIRGAQWASSSLSKIPLALRSPYLNIWTEDGNIFSKWPTLGVNKHAVGMFGGIRVDGKPYRWLGESFVKNATKREGPIQMSPTQTILKAVAGSVELTFTFISPIEPNDLVKQSFPFSYISVDISSTDGQKHSVQLYYDITGEILSDDRNVTIRSNTTNTASSIIHTFTRTDPTPFMEKGDQPKDGTLYLATSLSQPGTSWKAGNCSEMRGEFIANGTLIDEQEQDNTRKIQEKNKFWFCLGLAMDFGEIASSPSPAVWAVGLVRDPAIRAPTAAGTQIRSPYFMTKYSSVNDAVDDFLNDFAGASERASSLDAKIMGDGSSISSDYADLLAFASRSAFGAMDVTVARTSPTSLNASDVQIFMKDVGRSSRTNPVDVLFSAFPAFLYLNSTLAGLLLEPLFNVESLPMYQKEYAAPNLGSSYPDAVGNASATPSLEASGSMLIMALAYARKSGDGTQCQRHYALLKKWADYLVVNALSTSISLTSDLGVPAGDTNIALKAIIGVQAMSAINEFLEPQGASSADTSFYAKKALDLMQSWKNLALGNNFVKATFGDETAWSLMYNAYADRLLQTSLLSDDIYNTLGSLYEAQMFIAPLGLPYDSRQYLVRSDLTLLTASSLNNTAVRDSMIKSVHARAVKGYSLNELSGWPTSYDKNTGSTEPAHGLSSPAHGAAFSLLALGLPDQTIRLDPSVKVSSQGSTSTLSSSKHSVAGAAVGGAIGGLVLLALVVGGIFWYRRKRPVQEQNFDADKFERDPTITLTTSVHPPALSPLSASRLVQTKHDEAGGYGYQKSSLWD